VGCLVVAGVAAGAAGAAAGYGVDVAEGKTDFSLGGLATRVGIGAAAGVLGGAIGKGVAAVAPKVVGAVAKTAVGKAVASSSSKAASAITGKAATAGRAVANSRAGAKLAEVGKAAADKIKAVAGRGAPKGETVDIPLTKATTQAEIDAIHEYAKLTNQWLAKNGPKVIQSTAGQLRTDANALARAERLRAARAGTPYTGQAGHVPDTAISGTATPPAGWLDMPGKSNSIAGGVLGSRVGVLLRGFTVNGGPPL
jgi:hypothetical protein